MKWLEWRTVVDSLIDWPMIAKGSSSGGCLRPWKARITMPATLRLSSLFSTCGSNRIYGCRACGTYIKDFMNRDCPTLQEAPITIYTEIHAYRLGFATAGLARQYYQKYPD